LLIDIKSQSWTQVVLKELLLFPPTVVSILIKPPLEEAIACFKHDFVVYPKVVVYIDPGSICRPLSTRCSVIKDPVLILPFEGALETTQGGVIYFNRAGRHAADSYLFLRLGVGAIDRRVKKWKLTSFSLLEVLLQI
jgi:hypothetical protein